MGWKAIALVTSGLAIGCGMMSAPANAQPMDTTYRGTLVCGKMPFMRGKLRAAIAVQISGGKATYTHTVLHPDHGTVLGDETGSGSVEGDAIKLTGSWKGDKDSYDANYSGKLKRRAYNLSGRQVWTRDGKTVERACTGVAKRPLRAFIRKPKV